MKDERSEDRREEDHRDADVGGTRSWRPHLRNGIDANKLLTAAAAIVPLIIVATASITSLAARDPRRRLPRLPKP